jgi:hypothetical protein
MLKFILRKQNNIGFSQATSLFDALPKGCYLLKITFKFRYKLKFDGQLK